MNLSPNGVKLIQGFEKCELKAYHGAADPPNVFTIGWGHVHGIVLGMECTQEEADALFAADVLIVEDGVNDLVKVPITQNQFDALSSFAYNVGLDIDTDQVAEGLGDSTLLKKLNAGDIEGAADQFLLWVHANGVVVSGLTRRRQAERTLFLKLE